MHSHSLLPTENMFLKSMSTSHAMDREAVFLVRINEQISVGNDLACLEREHSSIILPFCPSRCIDLTDLDSSEEDDAECGCSERGTKNTKKDAGCSFSWIKQPGEWIASVFLRWWSGHSCFCLFILHTILLCSCVCKVYFLSPWHSLLSFVNSEGKTVIQWIQSLYQPSRTFDHIFLLLSLLLRWIESQSR